MAYLAKLARADAIGVILNLRNEGYVTYVAHNVPADTRWTEGPQGALLAQVLTRRTPEQAATVAIPLTDGRTADAVAVAPVVWKDQLVGARQPTSPRSSPPTACRSCSPTIMASSPSAPRRDCPRRPSATASASAKGSRARSRRAGRPSCSPARCRGARTPR